MIIAIGSDLCNIERIQNSLDRFGERFEKRVFTEVERAKAAKRPFTRAGTYAKRFAAKEAFSKAVGTGFKAYHYMMHDNDFCRGCHIFVPSGQLFVRPDTGTYLLVNAHEGKHDTLSCHACHPFEIKAQTKELYYWMVARPQEIPPHGKVPREICEQCHVTGPAKDTWKRITSTAGHRVRRTTASWRGLIPRSVTPRPVTMQA